nr:MAG TPA: hypothetical protein [Caudoviricetes sp.]
MYFTQRWFTLLDRLFVSHSFQIFQLFPSSTH